MKQPRAAAAKFIAAAFVLSASSVTDGSAANQSGINIGHARFRSEIAIAVDATDSDHQIFTVHETIPVQAPGPTMLLYPQWEIGSHAPTASANELAGLTVHVDGRLVEWRRDPVNVHAFTLDVPPGSRTIAIDLQFLTPSSSALLRPDMVVVPWHRMLLYPTGWNVRDLPVAARLTLPHGLKSFSSLDTLRVDHDTVSFATTTLEALVDAPVYAARYWRQFDLLSSASVPVRLDLVADAPGSLAITPEELAKLRAVVAHAGALLGPAPFRHYDAIVSLSDALSPGGGIEHLEEGENNLPASYFTDNAHQLSNRDLITHEYVHAWNGRFRAPADLWSADFNTPVEGSLLWVYEGQTEFWGRVLAARAGLRTVPETLDKLALDAALVANRRGRAWKSLADSGNDAIYMAGHGASWRDWQRREDYYPEGVLLWLDVDALMRELSGDQHGLDDFARRFFAVGSGRGRTSAYTFDDVCAALNAVTVTDWADFLRRHLETHEDRDAVAGLARSGWRLAYTATPTESFRQDEADAGVINFDYSIGMQVRSSGSVKSVVWHGPAFDAGLAPGARIDQVNG